MQESPTTFVANAPGWYSVTYDLSFTEGSGELGFVSLMVNGAQAGGQVPFTAPAGSSVSSVSDTQLFDCAGGGCGVSLLSNPGAGIFQLRYADIDHHSGELERLVGHAEPGSLAGHASSELGPGWRPRAPAGAVQPTDGTPASISSSPCARAFHESVAHLIRTGNLTTP